VEAGLDRWDESRPRTPAKRCTVENCHRPNYAKGLCRAHYLQIRRAARPVQRTMPDKPVGEGSGVLSSGINQPPKPRRSATPAAGFPSRAEAPHVPSAMFPHMVPVERIVAEKVRRRRIVVTSEATMTVTARISMPGPSPLPCPVVRLAMIATEVSYQLYRSHLHRQRCWCHRMVIGQSRKCCLGIRPMPSDDAMRVIERLGLESPSWHRMDQLTRMGCRRVVWRGPQCRELAARQARLTFRGSGCG
jgi:hypothetical protein